MEKTKTLEKPPTRLGRGLAALIPPSAAAVPSPLAPPELGAGGASPLPRKGTSEIALADIVPNPNQPRTVFNQSAIDELAASIRTHGVLQPVMVRPRAGGRYEIVAGERRYRAALEAGLKRIPAVVRSLTDEESLTVALIENIQREDLNPIEAARAYKQLMDDYGLTQTQLGEQIGKQQSTISNTMRLLRLSPEMQESIASGSLSLEHGKTLLGVEDAATRKILWRDFLDLNLNRAKTLAIMQTPRKRSCPEKVGPPPKRPTGMRWRKS